ncbi:MAG: RIP metalloprotease RseP [Bacteroidetes bacterium]|nr:MAG: RIP metalloprotease RseP [Bacteroidota bacterium]
MNLLAIDWSGVGVQAGYLLLSLSILVILHEFGHFLPAKWFGCRVEKFFLFFDPWFAVAKKKIGDTVYGIGWLPLGGYVKISGMVDESMDKEALKQAPQPWEFRSKPAWQRLIIMVGGVTVNVLVAFIIYSMILLVWGDEKLPTQNMKNGIAITDSLMYEMGLQDGDVITHVNGEEVKYFDDAAKRLLVGEDVTVLRNGKPTQVHLPENLLGELIEKKRSRTPLFVPRAPVVVALVPDSGAAKLAGLQPNDKIVSVNNTPTPFYNDYTAAIKSRTNDSIALQVQRNNAVLTLNTVVNAEGQVGFIRFVDASDLAKLGYFQLEKKEYNILTCIPAGIALAMDNLKFYVDQFKKILSPKTGAYKGVGGFKSMGSIFPKQWGDWEAFWNITAFLSIVLAFMNLLPIPALDGGHVMFLLYEIITGRKPSDKFMEYAQIVGMVLLFGLMIYANGNDWLGYGKGK